MSNQLGRRLRELGARPNTLVAVVMDKGWEQPVATLGILAAGAAYLPVDASLPAERVAWLLEHGQVAPMNSDEVEKNESLEAQFALADVDGDGVVDYEEFIAFYTTAVKAVESENLARDAFTRYDVDGSNSIEHDEYVVMHRQMCVSSRLSPRARVGALVGALARPRSERAKLDMSATPPSLRRSLRCVVLKLANTAQLAAADADPDAWPSELAAMMEADWALDHGGYHFLDRQVCARERESVCERRIPKVSWLAGV